MIISGPFTMRIFFIISFKNMFTTSNSKVFLYFVSIFSDLQIPKPMNSPCFSTGTDEESNEELALIIQAKKPRLLWEQGKKQNFVLDYLETIAWNFPAYFSCLNLAFQTNVRWSVFLWFRTSQNLAGKEIQRMEEEERGKVGGSERRWAELEKAL